jgi:hypothetical protein
VQVSILMVSKDEVLAHSRALLEKWKPVVVTPVISPEAVAANACDLLIICQTVEGEVAASVAGLMTASPPCNCYGDKRCRADQKFWFGSVQGGCGNPSWLPSVVARVLSAGAS